MDRKNSNVCPFFWSGYDSAGVAVISDHGELQIAKRAGRIEKRSVDLGGQQGQHSIGAADALRQGIIHVAENGPTGG